MNNKHSTVSALQKSRMLSIINGDKTWIEDRSIAERLIDKVKGDKFSCAGAKSALANGIFSIGIYGKMSEVSSAKTLCYDVMNFIQIYQSYPQILYKTFVAIFKDNVDNDLDFHNKFWRFLQIVNDVDCVYFPWSDEVSPDIKDGNFAFSVCGQAFYLVGLNPYSTRITRQYEYPVIAFNPHSMFKELRATGMMEKLQKATRNKDMVLQGSINPNLQDFGVESEALQYSGYPSVIFNEILFEANNTGR